MLGFKRALACAACVSATLTGVIVAPGSAFAGPQHAVVANDEQPSDDWLWVRYIAGSHPYSTVRTVAWSALISSAPEEAIAEFIASGYDYAVSLAEERSRRNLDFIRRVAETTTPEYSPEVHAEAKHLLGSGVTNAEREEFVRSGYEAAKARDRQVRDAVGEQKRALEQRDRDHVRLLSTSDPGEQVRLSASYAVREGSTDEDLVEFFAYGWATGARLDLEVFRMRHVTNNMRWRDTIQQLIGAAEAAEKAARDASDESRERAKAAAVLAWQQVGEQTGPARSAWQEAQEFTWRQAENWRSVLAAANAAQGPNWTSVIGPASTSETAWLAERDAAARQAGYWNGLLQQARDGEGRVKSSH